MTTTCGGSLFSSIGAGLKVTMPLPVPRTMSPSAREYADFVPRTTCNPCEIMAILRCPEFTKLAPCGIESEKMVFADKPERRLVVLDDVCQPLAVAQAEQGTTDVSPPVVRSRRSRPASDPIQKRPAGLQQAT